MQFSAARRLAETDLLVHVQVPRAGGASLQLFLQQLLGADRVALSNAEGVIDATPQALEKILCISGPSGQALQRDLPRKPAWVTVLRHPVDRFVSSYSAFLADPSSRHHAAASRMDINEFARHVLEGDDAALHAQFDNLQCRLVCGEADHLKAARLIDAEYLLAAPLTEIDDLAHMLVAALGKHPRALPRVGEPKAVRPGAATRLRLTQASVDALMVAQKEDALLYSHVQKAFAAAREGFGPARPRVTPAGTTTPAHAIPPMELRFMGETDEVFITHGDYLGERVVDFVKRFRGSEPDHLLDIGCGYGRLAYGLRRRDYRGRYAGFDILSRHIGWLVDNFAATPADERYRFDHADIYNERYNPTGKKGTELPLDYQPEDFDALVSLSVFTHLYEEEAVRYVRQLARLLQDGGLWITTFFCLPDGADWQAAPKEAVFPLASKVSEHAYIHSTDEPLYVIAFDEAFLLKLFAREGLEVVSQRKGRWFNGADAIELQDWFVLRKRTDWLPLALLPACAVPVRCNICGSREFATGPNGRLSPNGSLPRCLSCESLERHRAVRRIFAALPADYLADRRALQFSPDSGVDPAWFRSFELSVYEGENSLDLQDIDRVDASYDFLSSSHVLESVPDDIKAFDELCRILSPGGLMHVSFGVNKERTATVNLAEPAHFWGAHRYYGHDLAQRFELTRRGLHMLEIEAADPCTGVLQTVHLFTRETSDAAWLRDQLGKHDAITVR